MTTIISPKIEIRAATFEEIPIIDTINRQCLQENYDTETWEYLAKHEIINVAFVENVIVGYICLLNLKILKYSSHTKTTKKFLNNLDKLGDTANVFCIISIAVLPNYRNNKIGNELLKSILHESVHFILNVRETNIVAQKLYKKNEFEIFGESDTDYYSNPTENAYLMCKIVSKLNQPTDQSLNSK